MGLLDSVIGSATGGKSSPLTKALLMLLAAKMASSYFGKKSDAPPPAESGTPDHALSGKVESGILAGIPSLDSLLDHFRSKGHTETVDSWVGTGPNKPIQPKELEATLGPDALSKLQTESGLSKSDLLSQLAAALPQVIDKLTPGGKIPSAKDLHG